MKKTVLISFLVVCTFSRLANAAELPDTGSYTIGAQLSFGSIDHDSFNSDKDGAGQIMFFLDYYFKPGWAIEVGVNSGTNVQDWVCKNNETDDDYCTSSNDSSPNSFDSDLDYSNVILAVRFDKQASKNSFVYGKLGAQYFDYEILVGNSAREEDGTGIYSELGWRYEWSNSISANVGYQYIGMNDLTTSSLTFGIGYKF